MSALNDTLTEREVQHEWALHSPEWETDHMADPDICKLRAETSRMRTESPLQRVMNRHYKHLYEGLPYDQDEEEL